MVNEQHSLVIYHNQCYDGLAAAAIAYRALGESAEYLPMKYGEPFPMEKASGKDVFILDFSFPRQVLDEAARICRSIEIHDHHKTAEADLSGFPGATFDLSVSGAILAFRRFFRGRNIPLFYQYISDRDLWKFDLPKSREVSAALKSYPMDFRSDLYLKPSDQDIERLRTQGEHILRFQNEQVNLMVTPDKVRFIALGNTPLPAANATLFFSEVPTRLLDLYPSYAMAAGWFALGNGRYQFSLRSRSTFDVSVVARIFGGGGHPQSSGFTVDQVGFESIWATGQPVSQL